MESQFPEEVSLPIPPPLKAHMEDECFWILCRQKLLRLPRKPSVEDLLRQYYYHTIATPTDDVSPSLLAEVLEGIKIYFDFMTEDHLLYAPEREQFRLLVTDQQKDKGKSRQKTSNSHGKQDKLDSATVENSCLETSQLEHTQDGNPRQPNQLKPHIEHTPCCSSDTSDTVTMPSQVYGAEHLLRLFLKFPVFLSRAQLPATHVQLLHHYFKELLAYLCSRRTELFSEENYESQSAVGGGEEADTVKWEGEAGEDEQPLSVSS